MQRLFLLNILLFSLILTNISYATVLTCESQSCSTNGTYWNCTFVGCNMKPNSTIYNITNYNITVINQTIGLNETSIINEILKLDTSFNKTIENIEINNRLNMCVRDNEGLIKISHNYTAIKPYYEKCVIDLNTSQIQNTGIYQQLIFVEGQKPLFVLIGIIISYSLIYWFKLRKPEAETKMFPSSRPKGHGEESFDTKALQDEIDKIKKRLGGE